MGKVYWGYWDCPSCGNKDISGKLRTCPGCGRPRDDSVTIHATPHDRSNTSREYITDPKEIEHVRHNPDWHCSFCGSMNSAKSNRCPSCGHTREESDRHYFELHPERENRVIPLDSDDDDSNDGDYHTSTSTLSPALSMPTSSTASYDSQPTYRQSYHHHSDVSLDIDWRQVGLITLVTVLLIALVVGAFLIFMPKERYITVADIAWSRSIEVQEYRTVRESDWSVPAGGRIQYTQQEIHHYETVLDHYDTVTKSRQVITGSHEIVVGYIDYGNGAVEEVTSTVYDYGTEYYTEQEPVYRQDPVYQTRYYYDIERWVYDHTITSSAHDKEPYWPTEILKDNQRFNSRSQRYVITAVYDDDKTDDYTMDYEDWRYIEIGQELHVKVHFGDHIELLNQEE